MNVNINVLSYPETIFTGKISVISQVLDSEAKVLKARVVFMEIQKIEILSRNNETTYIASGLEENEMIVTNTRARIITQWPGRSAEEVEKFVTLPVMKEMNTIPKKSEVRSISLFGLSVVTAIQDWVIERELVSAVKKNLRDKN